MPSKLNASGETIIWSGISPYHRWIKWMGAWDYNKNVTLPFSIIKKKKLSAILQDDWTLLLGSACQVISPTSEIHAIQLNLKRRKVWCRYFIRLLYSEVSVFRFRFQFIRKLFRSIQPVEAMRKFRSLVISFSFTPFFLKITSVSLNKLSAWRFCLFWSLNSYTGSITARGPPVIPSRCICNARDPKKILKLLFLSFLVERLLLLGRSKGSNPQFWYFPENKMFNSSKGKYL